MRSECRARCSSRVYLNMSSESNDGARGLIIEPDGSVKDFTYTGYESLSKAVGGYLECITTAACTESGLQYDLWGDEEARLKHKPNSIVARKIVAEMGQIELNNVLTIHGTVVLLGSNEEGDTVELPHAMHEKYMGFATEDTSAHQGERDEPFTRVISESRKQHMDWAKARANELLDQGKQREAIASFQSDLGKHEETQLQAQAMAMYALISFNDSLESTRKWINDFN